jgi:membrane protein implicated in regulation of membrane protease activity
MVEDTDKPALGRLKRKAGEPAPVGAARCARLLRLAGRFAAVVLALATVLLLFVPAAHWLARRDIGSASGPLLLAAGITARGQLLILGAGLFAAGALVGAAQTSALSRRTLKRTEQRQVTGHYTKAVEQLSSDRLDVRIGGIYALESVARDSASDHPAVMEVLTAFIREHWRKPLRPPDSGRLDKEQWVRPDVQAALTVVARRKQERDVRPINLSGATLTRADLTGAHLVIANLSKTRLHRANLHGADLCMADLRWADLTGADLAGADLTGADLTGADLTGADLAGADLTDARWPQHSRVPEAGEQTPAFDHWR